MRCKKMPFFIIFIFIILFFSRAHAQDLSVITSNDCLKSIILSPVPPEILWVKQSPENPANIGEIDVSAMIKNNNEHTDDTPQAAWLAYSTDDGKTWQSVEMTQDENDESLWKGSLPGQTAATVLRYVVYAQDSGGNYAAEIPKNTVWPPDEKNNAFPVFPVMSSDENCTEKNNEPDVDILGVSLSYDDAYFYGKISVEGTVNGGTMSPTKANAYAQAILNLSEGQDPTVELLQKLFTGGDLYGFAMLHAPLAPDLGANAFGWSQPPWAIDARVAQTKMPIPQPESEMEGYSIGKDFYWRAKRALAGKDPDNTVLTAAAAISIVNPMALIDSAKGGIENIMSFLMGDISTITRVYLREHVVVVK